MGLGLLYFFRKRRLKKIFLDCGSYHGNSARHFQKTFPRGNEFKIHCFEANKEFEKYYEGIGAELHQVVVWDEDGPVKFFNTGGQGSSVFEDKSVYYENYEKKSDESLPGIDINRWIKENTDPDDYIILKLNVEGAEYKILQSLVKNGTIERINRLYVDWHCGKTENVSIDEHMDTLESLLELGVLPLQWRTRTENFDGYNILSVSDKDICRPNGKFDSRKQIPIQSVYRWNRIKWNAQYMINYAMQTQQGPFSPLD